MQQPSDPDRSQEKETARLEAFSDGVFGIAMTLLVLELTVPSLTGANNRTIAWTPRLLGIALLKLWPSYFAFGTSFFSILTMWIHHHRVLKMVQKSDALLMFANGFLLFMVTVVPFPTAVLAKFLMTPAARMAAGFYSGIFIIIALAFHLLLRACLREKVLSPRVTAEMIQRVRRGYNFGPLAYFVGLIAAFFSAWLSMAICTLLWVYWTVVTIDPERGL